MSKKNAHCFYVFYGENEFERVNAIRTMQRTMQEKDPSGMNYLELDGSKASVMEVINAAGAMPFLSDRRMVVVQDMLAALDKSKKGKKDLERLAEELLKLPQTARVVFHETQKLGAKNAILKLAQKEATGYAKAFGPPKNVVEWIRKRATSTHDIEIHPKAAYALSQVVKNDMRWADSELAKLAACVDYSREITEADVERMTTYVPEDNIFDITSAIANRNGEEALALTLSMVAGGKSPLYIIVMIAHQLRQLISALEWVENGGSVKDLAKAIRIPPFLGPKLYKQATQFGELDTLILIYRRLVMLDYEIKTGQIKDEAALQFFIASITR